MRRINRRMISMLFLITFVFLLIIYMRTYEASIRKYVIPLNNDNNDDLYNENDTNENFNDVLSAKQMRVLKQPLSLMSKIKMQNTQQNILNVERFGPISKDTFIITIQVHNRIKYLKYLIDSMSNAKDIDKALLIFSHDIYDDAINELINSIKFCMVMQIFYPYSIQLYPNTFPGTDPNDCPRDIERDEAEKIKCNNAKHPDTYDHYREAKFTQLKHHWWWKLNRIYDELKVTKDLDITLLLLEEDYYMSEDFLSVFKRMQKQVPRECPQCNVIVLGTFNQKLDENTYNKLEIAPWTNALHNMGMAFNKTTWKAMRECARHFCLYDEYNYDFSLQNINFRCLKKKLFAALIRGPRVFHVGECGTHHVRQNCDVESKINEINENIKYAKSHRLLYPEDLEISSTDLHHVPTQLTNNGGWADNRDQCLCLQMTHANKQSSNCRNVLAAAALKNDSNDL